MAAKNVTKVASTAFTPIENFGKKMASAVKYIPIPGTGGLSASSAGKIADRLQTIPEEKASKRLKESRIGRALGMGEQKDEVAMRKIQNRVKDAPEESVHKGGDMAKENLGYAMRDGNKYIE
jgi:hypothetical protein